MKFLVVKFFSLTEEELDSIEKFYKERNLLHEYRKIDYFEYIFELEFSATQQFESIIPSFGKDKFVGSGGLKIEEYLKEIAMEQGITLAVAESCTGGLISHRITNVSGSSDYFRGAVVAYSNSMKIEILDVREESIDAWGAVSGRVASEMAEGMATLSGTDYAVSSTGIAGPEGGADVKPVGTVWFGIRTPSGTETKLRQFSGTREEIKYKASSFAIFDLIRAIRNGRSR